MKFTTKVVMSAEITKFERFDYVDFEYIDFNDTMKKDLASSFDPKKFRLIFDLTNKDPNGDGYSIVATASHRKKAKFEIVEQSNGVFNLVGEAEITVPLKISSVRKNDFVVSIVSGDVWKGSENEVKLVFNAIEISDFNLAN